MKVLINSASSKMGGAVNYLANFLRHLPGPESGHEFVVFLPPENANVQENVAENVKLMVTSIGRAAWWKRIYWDQFTLRRALRKEKADVLLCQGNFGMLHCPVPQMVLVTNTLYFSKVYQQMFLRKHSLKTKLAFRLRRWLISRSVRSADIVMTPSQAMLDHLRSYVAVASDKALVNPYGVNGREAASLGPESERHILRSLPTESIRLVYVSLYSEHKNLSTLLKALPLLNANGARRFVLTTTANPAWEEARRTVTYAEDLALASQGGVRPFVEFVGPLGPLETEGLYRKADIFVFPSLTESFGFPMVEAMAHGLPIVASNTPINREICGEAALYFSPLCPEELAKQITRVATDDALRTKMATKGRGRAATQFRWSDHMRRILQTMESRCNHRKALL